MNETLIIILIFSFTFLTKGKIYEEGITLIDSLIIFLDWNFGKLIVLIGVVLIISGFLKRNKLFGKKITKTGIIILLTGVIIGTIRVLLFNGII